MYLFYIASGQTVQHHNIQPKMPLKVQGVLKTTSCTTKLQEYCLKFHLSDPDYTVFETQDGDGFYSKVTIANKSFTGAIQLDEVQARESAAVEFAVQLICLSKLSNTSYHDPHIVKLGEIGVYDFN